MNENKTIFRLLQVSTIFVFLGRAWQHFFFSGPYRSVLWDEGLFSWVALHVFGQDWASWTTNLTVDRGVILYSKIVGLVFLLSSILAVFLTKESRFSKIIIKCAAFFLLILFLVYWKDHFYELGQFFEHAIQFGTPILLLLWVNRTSENQSPFLLGVKIITAITFVSHGLYAVGYYAVPSHYIEMLMSILATTEEESIQLLQWMGLLDFVAALMILLPFPKAVKVGFYYCFIWGVLTALARPIAFFYSDFWMESLHQWGYQLFFRLPHGLIPLVGIFLLKWNESNLKLHDS